MQRVILVWCFVSVFLLKGALAQTDKKEETPPSWLPKAANTDSVNAKKGSKDLKSFVSGLDPAVSTSLPGGNGKSTTLSNLFGEKIPDLGLKVKEYKSQKADRKLKKEKARLAKVMYKGIPMEVMSIRYGSGDRTNLELFHVLKEYKPLDIYARATETRWYDTKSKKLSSALIKDKEKSRLLHGSYKKYNGENLIEEGFYYMGVKDGRWVKYDSKFNLVDKAIWNKGFPAESRITYYDSTHTKIKEVVPVMFGETTGEYASFFDEGQLKVSGKYDHGKKVGRWVEYYQYRRQRKKEIQHPKSSWDEEFDPFVLREWDEKGKLLYDYTKDPRASAEEETEN